MHRNSHEAARKDRTFKEMDIHAMCLSGTTQDDGIKSPPSCFVDKRKLQPTLDSQHVGESLAEAIHTSFRQSTSELTSYQPVIKTDSHFPWGVQIPEVLWSSSYPRVS